MRWVLYMSVLVTLATLACCLVSIVIPYWLYRQDTQIRYQGLWQRCEPIGSQGTQGKVECELILLPPEFLDAVRVMMFLALILYSAATISSFMYICCKQDKSNLITAALFFMLFGGICCLVALIVYAARYPLLLRARDLQLHAGFGLAVVSVIGAFADVLLYCIARAKGDVE